MKILIGLIEHFGDVVACEPVSRYLRGKYPDAHLSWAIRAPFRELIDTNPHIDETIILDCLTDWIKLHRHSNYDFVVDLHVNYRVCEHCRVPLVKEHGNPFVNAYEWFDYGAILEAFCQGAGLPKLSAQPQVYLNDQQRLAVDALQLPERYCVIHRESNSIEKDWRDANWSFLVRFLVEELKLPVVEVGAGKKRLEDADSNGTTWPRRVAPSSPVIDLVNRTTLLQTAEVIRRARFFIGIDSGPAHLANAVKTPGVILLGRILFFRQYTPFTGFYASNSPAVRLVRNLTGVVAELTLDEVVEATRYVARALDERDERTSACTKRSHPLPLVARPVDPNYRLTVGASGFFDDAWYALHHPEASESGMDLLDYFISVGAQAGHSPGPNFDAAWYTTQRPDLVVVTDSLKHYLDFGRGEGLRPCPRSASAFAEVSPPNEHFATTLTGFSSTAQAETHSAFSDESLPRIFAFYLPQFHPIAENNYGHRPGFTEWDNVIRAKPLFKGHYQPRTPGELGYYDLRSPDVIQAQIKLANDHGIAGFCFYYYYFHGKKLLNKPIENYIKSDVKAPFFFLWANENWSRRWDGGDNEVIVSQSHSAEDDLLFIRELIPVFSDERYVKVDGKPILVIYKPHLFPDARKTTELWRNEVVRHGFTDLYLVMADDWRANPSHPRELGFDASYEIPSNIVPEEVFWQDTAHLGLRDGFEGRIVDYRKFASFHMGRPFPEYKRLRTVMAPWDNTPRYGSRAMVHVNTDNDAYKLWLSEALIDTSRRYAPDERIVFLHSWNEWCEGTYVEPDGRDGRRLLEETKEIVDGIRRIAEQSDDALKTGMHLRRLMREKDEGAARSLQVMRQQNMYLYGQIEDLKHGVANAVREAAAREIDTRESAAQAVRDAAARETAAREDAGQAIREAAAREATARTALENVCRSKSWRVTKPLRAAARLLKRG